MSAERTEPTGRTGRLGVARPLLGVGIVVVIALHFVAESDPSRRHWQFLPEMDVSVPWESQGSKDDQRTLRLPVPGTAAIGYPAFRYAATPEDALRAGAELTSPLDANTASDLAHGAFVYDTFCAVCHGVSGDGRGSVTSRGVPPPPSLLVEHARDMKDGQMVHVITLGQGNMAAYASQVERTDRWRAILHARSLQAAAREATQESTERGTEER